MMNSFQITPPETNLNKDYLYNTYGFYAQDDCSSSSASP